MSIKTTYDISRQTAIDVIINHTADLTNYQLSQILENLPHQELRSFSVSDKLPNRHKIESVTDF